jgi:small subunit ribosomal protein S29e
MGHLEMWRSNQAIKMGKGARYCRICGNGKGLIRKYGLYVCRQCFRENHDNLGFHKVQ